MVRDGKITAEVGVNLLEVLDKPGQNINDDNNNSYLNVKWIKVRVIEPNGKSKVNITLPVSLLSIGVKLAEKFSPEFQESGLSQNDLDEILDAIKGGAVGKVVDIETDKGEKVEVIVE